jgi:hypothetical protein
LETGEKAKSEEIQAACRSRKCKDLDSFLKFQKEHSPSDKFHTSDFQHCNIIHLCATFLWWFIAIPLRSRNNNGSSLTSFGGSAYFAWVLLLGVFVKPTLLKPMPMVTALKVVEASGESCCLNCLVTSRFLLYVTS